MKIKNERYGKTGKIVGAGAVEFALGKGVGSGLNTLKGTQLGTALIVDAVKISKELKTAIGKTPLIPPGFKLAVTNEGLPLVLREGEWIKLEELIKPMESRAKEALSGENVARVKPINLPAWNKLTFKVDEGETLPHFLTGHKTGESRLSQSIKDGGKKDIFPESMTDRQIINAIKTAYNNSKKIETQFRRNGEKVIVLIGEADGMKIKMYVNVTTKQLETAFPQWGLK